MPGSIRENDDLVRGFVTQYGINKVLDVGAGQGTYADLIGDKVSTIRAIEIWQPYIDQFDLYSKYDVIYEVDAREALVSWANYYDQKQFDLVIFGDVLEHMTEAEALTCWEAAGKIAQWGLISVPCVHYPQGAEFGNPYEVHVQDHLTPEKVREMFGPFDIEQVYNVTGTFIKRF